MPSSSSTTPVNIEMIRAPPPPPPRRRRDNPFVYTLVTLVILIYLITTAFAFLIWVIVRPNDPQLHVSYASMSNFTATNTTVSANFNITLIFTNTNKHLKVIYRNVEISLIYPSQGVILSQIYHPSFVQPKRNQTTVGTNINCVGVFLGLDVLEAMNQDLGGQILTLGLNVFAVVYYKNGKWITRSQFMRAYCGNLIFGLNEEGMSSIPIGQCIVDMF